MANPMQRAAVRRKGLYIALIVALFTVSIFWRGKLDVPFGNPARAAEAAPSGLNRAADALARRSVLAQATDLELRELDQGDPEIAGTAARCIGFAMTATLHKSQISSTKSQPNPELPSLGFGARDLGFHRYAATSRDRIR